MPRFIDDDTTTGAPNGAKSSVDGTEFVPISGNYVTLISTILEYIRTATSSFTNKTLGNTNTITVKDANLTIQDDSDTTKQAKFQASGITTATTRTITLPDASGTATLLGNSSTGSGNVVLATSPTITTPTISGAIAFPDDVRQTFNPGANAAGLNVGSHAGDPGTPSNGDIWYDSASNELTARIGGSNVVLGAAGASSDSFKTIAVSGQSDVVADSSTDTLTLVAGSNVTITTNAGADSVTITAATGSGLTNSNISPTTTNITASVNTRYFANVSGLTANRNFIVPAGAVGDIIELNIKTGDDTYAFIVIGDTGISINGGSTATEWSRVFISGETIQLIADTTTNWQVVIDKRIPCKASIARTTTQSINNATLTKVLHGTTNVNIGDIVDIGNSKIVIRRAGNYRLLTQVYFDAALAARWIDSIQKNGAQIFSSEESTYSALAYGVPQANNMVALAAADYIEQYCYQTQGGSVNISPAAGAEAFVILEEVF